MNNAKEKHMISPGHLDRREFIGLSVLTTAATLLPESLHADEPSQPALVSLQVTGNVRDGYGVTILYRGQAIARHHQDGELSAIFQNCERSLEDRVDDWRAASWSGDRTRIELTGEIHLLNLRTTVFVDVIYEVMTSQLVKKTIRLRQADMYTLLYQLSNRLEPETVPVKLWSFDQADCKGGPLHEYFPAAGFRTHGGVT